MARVEFDPGTLDTHQIVINWGDGSSDTQNLLAGVLAFSGTHSYKDNGRPLEPGEAGTGPYTVIVTATDDDGGVGTYTTDAMVTNVPPSLTYFLIWSIIGWSMIDVFVSMMILYFDA